MYKQNNGAASAQFSRNHEPISARLLRHARAWLLVPVALIGISTGSAHADTLRAAKVTVTPLTADINVPRQINVSGTWPHACGPMDATLVPGGANSNGALTVKLTVPLTLVACAQVLTAYNFTVNYTPTVRGVQRIAVITTDGELLGSGSLITRSADDNGAVSDLTGLWYDPATNGSGVTLIHNGADQLFGTWYMYDSSGKARWFSIQTLTWTQQGRGFNGILYETFGRANACTQPVATCPAEIIGIAPVALARFTLNANGSAKIEALDIGGSGQVLFTSNLTRAVF